MGRGDGREREVDHDEDRKGGGRPRKGGKGKGRSSMQSSRGGAGGGVGPVPLMGQGMPSLGTGMSGIAPPIAPALGGGLPGGGAAGMLEGLPAVIIKGLPPTFTNLDLSTYFGVFGTVSSAEVLTLPGGARAGRVVMARSTDVLNALQNVPNSPPPGTLGPVTVELEDATDLQTQQPLLPTPPLQAPPLLQHPAISQPMLQPPVSAITPTMPPPAPLGLAVTQPPLMMQPSLPSMLPVQPSLPSVMPVQPSLPSVMPVQPPQLTQPEPLQIPAMAAKRPSDGSIAGDPSKRAKVDNSMPGVNPAFLQVLQLLKQQQQQQQQPILSEPGPVFSQPAMLTQATPVQMPHPQQLPQQPQPAAQPQGDQQPRDILHRLAQGGHLQHLQQLQQLKADTPSPTQQLQKMLGQLQGCEGAEHLSSIIKKLIMGIEQGSVANTAELQAVIGKIQVQITNHLQQQQQQQQQQQYSMQQHQQQTQQQPQQQQQQPPPNAFLQLLAQMSKQQPQQQQQQQQQQQNSHTEPRKRASYFVLVSPSRSELAHSVESDMWYTPHQSVAEELNYSFSAGNQVMLIFKVDDSFTGYGEMSSLVRKRTPSDSGLPAHWQRVMKVDWKQIGMVPLGQALHLKIGDPSQPKPLTELVDGEQLGSIAGATLCSMIDEAKTPSAPQPTQTQPDLRGLDVTNMQYEDYIQFYKK